MTRYQKLFRLLFFTVVCMWLGTGVWADRNEEELLYQCRLWKRTEFLVLKEYVRPVSKKLLFEQAIGNMMKSLDMQCKLIVGDKAVQKKYEIGIRIRLENGTIKIITPLKGTPAFMRGIWPGDEIVKVDGKAVAELNAEQIFGLVRSPDNIEKVLEIKRKFAGEEKKLVFKLKPETPKSGTNFYTTEYISDNNLAYIRLINFREGGETELGNLIRNFMIRKVDGLIIDLRDCVGGTLKSAVRYADLFLREGVIVEIRSRSREYAGIYRAKVDGTLAKIPLVLIVGRDTAGAAEIFAGALQGSKHATAVGEDTAGDTDQTAIFRIDDQYAIRMTVGRCVTPAGRVITRQNERGGIIPDHIVELKDQQYLDWLKFVRCELIRLNCPEDAKIHIKSDVSEYEDTTKKAAIEFLKKNLSANNPN